MSTPDAPATLVEEVPAPAPVGQQEESAVVVPATEPVETPEATAGEAAAGEATAPAVDEVPKDEKPEVVPKTFINRFFGPIKFKRTKKNQVEAAVPADPKVDEVTVPEAEAAVPEAEATVPEVEAIVPKAEATDPKAETADPKAEATDPKAEVTDPKDVVTESGKIEVAKALKLSRRLSARVGDFFKTKSKAPAAPPIKVDENPPVIEHPQQVAPLEVSESEIKVTPAIAATA